VAAVPPAPEETIDVVEPMATPDLPGEAIVSPEPATAPAVAALPPAPVLTPGVLVLLRRMNMNKNFVLEGVNFELDKTSFKDDAYQDVVKNLGMAMLARPNLSVRIEVHTDGLGDAEFNKKLTEARARMLKEMLVREYNIDDSRIEAAGFGGERPLLPNINRKNREANRRVELNVLQGP
jgi:OOP family OmpA-OmpF porin